VPSSAFVEWRDIRLPALGTIDAAHTALEGSGPGRRFRTAQLNGGYVVLVAGQFQAFCRSLHSEAAFHLTRSLQPPPLRDAIYAALTQGRQLDTGNATPGNIGSDYARLGMDFWPAVKSLSPLNGARQTRLNELVIWRNSIAHQAPMSAANQLTTASTGPTLRWARTWRSACKQLAKDVDRAVGDHLAAVLGKSPW
jgi:hypothetical protein